MYQAGKTSQLSAEPALQGDMDTWRVLEYWHGGQGGGQLAVLAWASGLACAIRRYSATHWLRLP